ncbi:MAG: invasion associated locus B family protein [Dongiaceae bacterium]
MPSPRSPACRAALLVLAALALLAPRPAAAEDAPGAPTLQQHFAAWTLGCYPPRPPTGPRLLEPEAQSTRQACQIEQPVRLADQDKVAAVVRVRLLGPKRQPFLLFVLPPNTDPKTGLSFAVGEQGDAEQVRIRNCTPRECVAARTLDEDLLERLGHAESLLIGFRPGGKSVAALLALAGFTEAYRALLANDGR